MTLCSDKLERMKQQTKLLALCATSFMFTGCFLTSLFAPKERVVEEAVAIEEDEVLPPVVEEINPIDQEYLRSAGDISVSRETFMEDKRQILSIISDLETVMASKNYKKWLSYLDSESVSYWSQRSVLQRAASRLPVKGLKLTTLEDYFRYIFISSRAGKRVDEIRYITTNSVKAVQVDETADIVYYNFHKVDEEWKLHLPELSD